MVDDVDVDRHQFAFGDQIGNVEWRDGGGSDRHVTSFAESDGPGSPDSSAVLAISVPNWSNHHPETVGRRIRVPI
jgi:hypothetical protein